MACPAQPADEGCCDGDSFPGSIVSDFVCPSILDGSGIIRRRLTLCSSCVAGIVKITFLNNYGQHGDFLFDSSDLTIWYVIEQAVKGVGSYVF